MSIDVLAQAALDGVVVGAMISLAALGLTFIWAVEGFANIAQGDTLTVAAYLTLGLSTAAGLSLIVSAPTAVAATVVIVLVTERLVFRPLSSAPRVTLLIASIGVALLYRGAISLAFGTRFEGYDISAQRAISLGIVRITPLDLVIIGVVAAMLALVYVVLFRTRTGMEMRAVADVPALARVSGIDSRRVLQITWGLSAAISAVGGILLGAKVGITPLLGWNILLAAFAATVLGSVGNPTGAVIGGIVLGVVTETSALFISPTYKQAVAFAILAVILLFRPRGIFSGR